MDFFSSFDISNVFSVSEISTDSVLNTFGSDNDDKNTEWPKNQLT
jgi:hypothetical protein